MQAVARGSAGHNGNGRSLQNSSYMKFRLVLQPSGFSTHNMRSYMGAGCRAGDRHANIKRTTKLKSKGFRVGESEFDSYFLFSVGAPLGRTCPTQLEQGEFMRSKLTF